MFDLEHVLVGLDDDLYNINVYLRTEGGGEIAKGFCGASKDERTKRLEYDAVVGKIKAGDYKVHLYDNGILELELL